MPVGKEGVIRFHGGIYLQKLNLSAVSGPPVFHQETTISHLANLVGSLERMQDRRIFGTLNDWKCLFSALISS